MSVGAIETQTAAAASQPPTTDAPEALVVALSDKAAEKVREIRTEENIEDTYALRLKVQGGGCSGFSYDLYFDQPQETDRAFDVKGVKLICDEMSLMYLVGTEVDYVEGLHGAGLQVPEPERQVDLRVRQLLQRLTVFNEAPRPGWFSDATLDLLEGGEHDVLPPFFLGADWPSTSLSC